MINKEDIKNLASLARIRIAEDEMESLTKEIDSILGYVGQVKSFGEDFTYSKPVLRNVLREDIVTNKPEEYTSSVLANSPKKDKQYVEVKNIF